MPSRSGNQAPAAHAICRGKRRSRPQHRGFTLGEMTVATAVAGVLVLGMSSAVMFSLQAGEVAEGTKDTGTETANVLDQITRDLGDALAFNERSSVSAAFTVPDRDGDGKPERLRYAWSGVAGDPITLQYGGSPAVKFATNVHHFNLNYLLRTVGPSNGACCLPEGTCMEDSQANCAEVPGALYKGDGSLCRDVECPVESEEMLLVIRDPGPEASLSSYKVKENNWCAAYFLPSLPINVVSWKVTRVMFLAKQSGNVIGSNAVDIRTATGEVRGPRTVFIPTNTVLDTVIVDEASLPASHDWVGASFDTVSGLDPANGLCLVIRGLNGSRTTAGISYAGATVLYEFLDSLDGGAEWRTEFYKGDMGIQVFGTVTTLGPPEWP